MYRVYYFTMVDGVIASKRRYKTFNSAIKASLWIQKNRNNITISWIEQTIEITTDELFDAANFAG